jgi:nucleotide-binding universal stress UspA family protein
MRPSDPSVPVEYRLEEGDPAAGILRAATESACDLIVMGAGQRGGLWRALAGSVSRAVARRASLPVVRVTVPDERSHPAAPRRVILATDREEPDASAFELARSLSRNGGEELFALFVRPAGGSDGGKAVDPRLTERGAGIQPLARVGSLVEEVLRAAHDLRPALVVMGTPARTGLGELFDPARAVRRRAACPVLSVHLPVGRGSRVAGVGSAPVARRHGGRG